jgi:hypothetical protein
LFEPRIKLKEAATLLNVSPSITDWISAVSTAGALLAAVVAGILAYHVYKIESQRDRVAESTARRQQAHRVAAWATPKKAVASDADSRHQSMVMIQNGSDLPIWDVDVELHLQFGHERTLVGRWLRDVLPPGLTELGTAEWNGKGAALTLMEFRDAEAHVWRRDTVGRLDAVTQE